MVRKEDDDHEVRGRTLLRESRKRSANGDNEDEYGLEIKKRNGKWAIERIKGLESMNNNGN